MAGRSKYTTFIAEPQQPSRTQHLKSRPETWQITRCKQVVFKTISWIHMRKVVCVDKALYLKHRDILSVMLRLHTCGTKLHIERNMNAFRMRSSPNTMKRGCNSKNPEKITTHLRKMLITNGSPGRLFRIHYL